MSSGERKVGKQGHHVWNVWREKAKRKNKKEHDVATLLGTAIGTESTDAMARKLALLGLAAVIGSAAAGSVSLTEDTFDKEVFDSGKNAFIKFQAPW